MKPTHAAGSGGNDRRRAPSLPAPAEEGPGGVAGGEDRGAREGLREVDREARGHLTTLSNRIHLATTQLRRDPAGVDGAAGHLDEALVEVDRLKDVLDEVRRLARARS